MNTSRARTTLLMLLWAAFAVLAALLVLRPGLDGPMKAAAIGLDPEAIQRLTVSGPKASTVVLVRHGDGWVIAEPARLLPEPTQLGDLLAVTAATSRAGYPLSELSLEETGLEQPGVTLTVDDVKLEFGARAPVSGDRYVRIGEQIHLLSNAHYHTLTLPLYDYVATKLLPEQGRLNAMRLPDLTVRRDPGDGWTFDGEVSEKRVATSLVQLWETADAVAIQPYSETATVTGRVELDYAHMEQPMVFEVLEIPGKADFVLGRAKLGLQYHFAPETGRRLLGMDGRLSREAGR